MSFVISFVICVALLIISPVFCEFDPYVDHGGTIVAVAGKDYVVVATDTRLNDASMGIPSRNVTRIVEIHGIVLAATGCHSDCVELFKVMEIDADRYLFEQNRPISLAAFAHRLFITLYSRRLAPYFSYCCVAGIDKNGIGCVYNYDPVGSYERNSLICTGSAKEALHSILDELSNSNDDNGLWIKNINDVFESSEPVYVDMEMDAAVDMVDRAFRAAAEREAKVGDGIHIWTLKSRDSEYQGNRNFIWRKAFRSLPSH